MNIRSKLIQILSTQQSNRLLNHKLTCIRLIIPEEVVVQPRFKVAILVLQAEGLIRILVNPLILFQMTPAGIVAEPQELAVLIGHLSWDADLVAVELVGLLGDFSVFVVGVSIGETAYVRTARPTSGLKVLCRIRLSKVSSSYRLASLPCYDKFRGVDYRTRCR